MVPVTFNVTVGTTPARIKSSSTLAVRWQLVGATANTARVWYGDSNVSATRGVPVAVAVTALFETLKPHNNDTYAYDLSNFWVVSTAAAQVAQITYYTQFKNK